MAETTVKQDAFAFIASNFQHVLEHPASHRAIFSAVNIRQTSSSWAGIPPDCGRLAEKLALKHLDCFPGPFYFMPQRLRRHRGGNQCVSLQKCANFLIQPEYSSAKGKDHHGVSSGWSSVWHRSNTGLSSTQYEQIPIILRVWPFWLTPFFFRSITFWRAYG